jgi:hypothetical protein
MRAHERRSARPQGILHFAAVALPLLLFMACNAILGIGEPRDPPPETGGMSGTSNNGATAGRSAGGSSGSGAGARSTTGASGGESGGTDPGDGGSGGADAGSGGLGGEDSGSGGVGGADAGDGGVGGAGAGNGGSGGANAIVVSVTSAEDTTIQSNFDHQGNELVCQARSDSGSVDFAAIACLMRWDLSLVPPGSSIVAVAFQLYVTNGSLEPISVYPILASWSETSVSWTDRSNATPWEVAGAIGPLDRGGAIGVFLLEEVGPVTLPLDSQWIALVQSWVDTPSTNFGISFGSANNANGIHLATRENLPGFHPQIVVSYLPPLPR